MNATTLTPDEMRQKAEAWYGSQIETLRKCHGQRWPEHQTWIESYLQAQIRQRLLESGWRFKR